MFIVEFLPVWVFTVTIIAGVIAMIGSHFFSLPFLQTYKLPVQLLAACAIGFGTWFHGAASNQEHWEQKVAELEQKVQIAEAKSAVENVRIETKIVEKIVKIKETTDANKTTFRQELAQKVDSSCKLPDAVSVLLDSASKNEVAGSTTEPTPGTATVEASTVFEVVIENYGICNQYRETIKGWQEWYWTQKKIFEESQK